MARVTTGLDKHQLEFVKLIDKNSHAHRPYEVFRDFCELAAIAMSNAVDKIQFKDREARYLKVVKGYTSDEVKRFSEMLACIVNSLEGNFSDCLGALFMSLELGSHWKGQFFTPYPVSLMMAKILGQSIGGDFESLMEPAVGAGGMVIARAQTLKEMDINYQQKLHVTAFDVDLTAVHMAYIQFTLLHIPAVIIHGNSLSNETWGHWVTPAHVLGFWDSKLSRLSESTPPLLAPIEAMTLEEPVVEEKLIKTRTDLITKRNIAAEQLNLF